MVEYLKPFSQNHSIAKVRAILFLPQAIIRPEELLKELNEKSVFPNYQKKTLRKSRTIGINFQNTNATSNEEIVDGFVLEEYDERGLLINYLSLSNEQNRAVITFENRKYTVWSDFFIRLKEDVEKLSEYLKIYIDALSLTYLDEFVWMNNSKIPVNEIFDIDSDLINKKFLESENGSIVFVSQNLEEKNEERTEIAFSNKLKRVSINHQYILRLNSKKLYEVKELIENKEFDSSLNLAHDSNKNMLDNLLSQAVKKKIGLN